MRFHQAVAFLETEQLVGLARGCDDMGYAGMYLCDHIFYPQQLDSKYPYSPHEDGSPIWSPETHWPDMWCLVSAMAMVTQKLEFTSGVYIAPARDVFTVAKLVGTAAYLSENRVNLGVGVGWCEEEFDATGQEFHNRGKRLDEMIPALRELWKGGWVEYHGEHYDFGPLQMNPTPTAPVPIYGGGHSEPALRRAARLCDGWMSAGAYAPDDARDYLAKMRQYREEAGRADEPFSIYMTLAAMPDVDLYRDFEDEGVTDMVCAPWMLAGGHDSTLDAKVAAAEDFATTIIAKM